MLGNGNNECVISTTEYDFHPLRAFSVKDDNKINFQWQEYELTRSQDLPNMVHDAGAFYFFTTVAFKQQKRLLMNETFGLEIPKSRAVDIDILEDFELAELLQRRLLNLDNPK